MWAFWIYLRLHRWQRRALTVSLAMVLGGLVALISRPHVEDWLLLRNLGSRRAAVRGKAILWGVERARESPRTLRRLEKALDTPDDAKFLAIVAVLRRLDRLQTPQRDPVHLDRWRALEVAGNPDPQTREDFLDEVIRLRRAGPQVRSAMAAAARDAAVPIRAKAAVLAARLKDDEALGGLLADADPNVVASAALAAGIAARTAHLPRLRELLQNPQTAPSAQASQPARAAAGVEVQSSAAYALARLEPGGAAGAICWRLAQADEAYPAELRDRLLHVAAVLGGPQAGQAVMGVIAKSRRAGRHPPAAAILAAGKLGLAEAAPDIRDVLAAVTSRKPGEPPLQVGQVMAALDAAGRLDMPIRKEAEAICRQLWSQRWPLMMVSAARALGEQARQARQSSTAQASQADAPSIEECVQTLRLAATYDFDPSAAAPATGPASAQPTEPVGPRRLITTPLASAAAAVALWELRSEACEEFIEAAAGDITTLPGDYIAWHLGLGRSQRAFDLALAMLPPPDAPPDQRVYNDNIRSTGALLLALAADTPRRKAQAVERIRSRLEGRGLGGEDSFYVRGAYRCALAMLGQQDEVPHVVALLQTGQFSQRRAITALTLAGRPDGLDWLLWNPQVPEGDVLFLLVDELLGEVLQAVAPELPAVDASAPPDLQAWQLRILRWTYAIACPPACRGYPVGRGVGAG